MSDIKRATDISDAQLETQKPNGCVTSKHQKREIRQKVSDSQTEGRIQGSLVREGYTEEILESAYRRWVPRP